MRASPLLIGALTIGTLPSCTLGKPLVCFATGPVYALEALAEGEWDFNDCCRNPCATLVGIGGWLVLAGPVAGLFTGLVSDWNWMTGQVPFEHSQRNIENPFITNAPRAAQQ